MTQTAHSLAKEIDLEAIDCLIDFLDIPSRRALAIRAGVNPSTFTRICQGKSDPSLSTVCRLARALGVTIDKIVRNDDEPTALKFDPCRPRSPEE